MRVSRLASAGEYGTGVHLPTGSLSVPPIIYAFNYPQDFDTRRLNTSLRLDIPPLILDP